MAEDLVFGSIHSCKSVDNWMIELNPHTQVGARYWLLRRAFLCSSKLTPVVAELEALCESGQVSHIRTAPQRKPVCGV
jgi:hypothetical protein